MVCGLANYAIESLVVLNVDGVDDNTKAAAHLALFSHYSGNTLNQYSDLNDATHCSEKAPTSCIPSEGLYKHNSNLEDLSLIHI